MAIPDSSRLPRKIRDPNPCTGCTRPWKNPGCHDHCTDREVWLEELRRVGALAGFRNVYRLAKKISSMKGDVRNRDKGKNSK